MPSTLLALETATDVCSVALVQDRRVTVALTLTRPRAHAENLVPMIAQALAYGGVAASALDAVAVSAGPGSYTGLRIGVSTAKGLVLATDACLVAVPTLEALAANVLPMAAPGDGVCTLLGARRDEVFAAAFRCTPAADLDAVAGPVALAVADVPGWLAALQMPRCWLVGGGVERAWPALHAAGLDGLRPLDAARVAPSASWVAQRALPRLLSGQTEDPAAFEPAYLKAFVAKMPAGSIFDKLSF